MVDPGGSDRVGAGGMGSDLRRGRGRCFMGSTVDTGTFHVEYGVSVPAMYSTLIIECEKVGGQGGGELYIRTQLGGVNSKLPTLVGKF